MLNDESLRILQESRIFRGLSDDHVKMVSTYIELSRFNNNDIIIEEGQTGHPLYIIMRGQVEVFLPEKGKNHTEERPTKISLKMLTQGECLGEYSLMDNEPASASVVAVKPCEILKISRENFKKIINSGDYIEKVIYKNMLRVLIKRARDYDKELDLCF
jgi:CRP/FNR family cyclic AMP-dependent transcriptional regulator